MWAGKQPDSINNDDLVTDDFVLFHLTLYSSFAIIVKASHSVTPI